MADIILSIHPKWAEKIYSGEKTVEVRKTRPRNWCSFPDRIIYFYETAPVKKITGFCFLKFASKKNKEAVKNLDSETFNKTCLTEKELIEYSNGKDLCFWNLKDPRKFDTPIDLKGSVPQSWRYVKKGEINS